MLTDERCELAPGSAALIASTSPVCASEVTSATPDMPRAPAQAGTPANQRRPHCC